MIYRHDPSSYTKRQGSLGEYCEAYSAKSSLAGKNLIVGYPQDEGVRKNLGHTGQNLGPLHFRKAFYSLQTCKSKVDATGGIVDYGDIASSDKQLTVEEAQLLLSEAVFFCLKQGAKKSSSSAEVTTSLMVPF